MPIQYTSHGAMPGTCDAAQGPEADTTKHFPLPSVGADAVIHARPSPLLLKAGPAGEFSGVAWAFAGAPDAVGDLITEAALGVAAKGAPWPVLVDHAGPAVGEIVRAGLTAEGLAVAGVLDTGTEAYAKARSGELPALSIGFFGRAEKAGGLRVFTEIQLAEVSLTRAPINQASRVTSVKSWDQLSSERELVALLKAATGMPGRLAQKIASAAWPHIQHPTDEPDPALLRALRRLASAT